MDACVFRFRIRLAAGVNPPEAIDRFAAGLRAFFAGRGWQAGVGAFGGSATCYGEVGGPECPAAEWDRDELAEWVRRQRICATVRIGELESVPASIITRMRGREFAVDNLTEQDRLAAALHHEELRRQLARLRSA
jgi:hypothetical protein